MQSNVTLYTAGYMFPSIIVNSDIFRHIHVICRHIQPYYGIFRTLCNLHIQNPVIFYPKARAYLELKIFRTLFRYSKHCHIQNLVKTYSGIFRTLCNARTLRSLPYSELCHIQNFRIFRAQGIFRILFI